MDIYSLSFSVSNLGPKSFQKIVNKFGNPEAGWNGKKEGYEEIGIKNKTFKTFDDFRASFNSIRYSEQLKKSGVEFVSFFDKLYPQELKKIDNPPIGLFCKGNKNILNETFCIGVVGTRKVTQYGKSVTDLLVSQLVQNGVCIVSGLALGVDALAHRTTLKNNGKTIAVLGCGVDCVNPSENYSLYTEILKNNGLIVSEYPLGMQPNKGTFPARNRIIAAITQGVLITEAAEDSGSLITADYALKFGKKVFAVPGPINSQMAQGSLKLLKQGAKLVTDAKDIMSASGIKYMELGMKSRIQNLKLSKDERKTVEALENEEMTVDEICKKTKIIPTDLMVLISRLELKGVLTSKGGKISLK